MRLIDADKLDICDGKCRVCARDRGTECENLISCSDVIDIINDAQTVDPVKHGRWIVHEDGYAECSQCRKMMFIPKVFVKHPENITDRYCNMCGAKMDEVSE